MATFLITIPACVSLTVRETRPIPSIQAGDSVRSGFIFKRSLLLLLVAQVLAMTSNGVGNMGRSISMSNQEFSSTAMTTTAAIGGALSLPLPFILGWLSDVLGRRGVIIASYLSGTACVTVLIFSTKLWHFWVAAALLSLLAVSMSVGPAFVADIVETENVGTGVSLLQSSQWIGTIIGFTYSGFAFQRLGIGRGLATASIAGLLGTVIIMLIRNRKRSVTAGISPIRNA
jgi:MFS family permease